MTVDAYEKTASFCFDMARNCVRSVAPGAVLSYEQRQFAEYEAVCVLVHFIGRVIWTNDPVSFNERMSALVTAALRICTQAARDAVPEPSLEPGNYQPPGPDEPPRIVTRKMYEEGLYQVREAFYRDKLDQVSADATDAFMNLYCDRVDEYSELGDDWFRLLLVRFGKHLCEAMNPDYDLKAFFNAELEVVKMFDALRDYVGDILATPAT